MPGIFISYRREDSAAYAGRVYDWVSQHFGKDRIFIDVDSIQPGEDFVDAIQDRVGMCDALIALIGKQWLSCVDEEGTRRLDNPDDFVRVEVATALTRNVRVIPVLLDGARMPRGTELPDALAKLARRNAIELSYTRFHQDVERLIEALDKALGAAEQSRAAAVEAERAVAQESEAARLELERKRALEAREEAERAAAEELERKRAVAAKAEAERAAGEEAEAQTRAALITAELLKRGAQARAERQRLEEKVERRAVAKAEGERLAAEESKRKRVAAKVEADRIAAEEAERQRVAAAQAEAMRAAAEAERQRADQAQVEAARIAADESERRPAERVQAEGQRAGETLGAPGLILGEPAPGNPLRMRLSILIGVLVLIGGMTWYFLPSQTANGTATKNPPAAPETALDEVQIAGLLAANLPPAMLAAWISRDGLTFANSPSLTEIVEITGAKAVQSALAEAARYGARAGKSTASVMEHLVRAADFHKKGLNQPAQDEYRAALAADPGNPALVLALESQGVDPSSKPDRRTVIVSIKADGSLMINNEPADMSSLGARLEDIFKMRAERVLFVRTDPGRPFSDLAKVVSITLGAGIDHIAFLP